MHKELLQKNRIATHYFSLVWWFMYKQIQQTFRYYHKVPCNAKNNIQLCVLTFHMAGMVNHAINNETAKITVAY